MYSLIQLSQDDPLHYWRSKVIPKYNIFLSLKIDFVLPNIADSHAMQDDAIFHLGLRSSPNYSFLRFLEFKRLKLAYTKHTDDKS